MIHINDLPSKFLFQVSHGLRALVGGAVEDLYGSSLMHAFTVRQLWFELTCDIYRQGQRKRSGARRYCAGILVEEDACEAST